MSIEDNKPFDPKDKEKIKEELQKEDANLPCNIWGILKEILERINVLESKINEIIGVMNK